MNSIFANTTFQNMQFFNNNNNPLAMSNNIQGLTSLINNLQNTVVKQQALINTLQQKVQEQEKKKMELSLKIDSIPIKMEADLTPTCQAAVQCAETSSQATEESLHEDKEITKEQKTPKIIRRNGFKADKSLKTKLEEEIDSDDKDSKEKNSSKAKHLWVNYGRRILEYAINQTKGAMQTRVKQLVGKLNSKKDFERTFQITEADSTEDKLFKTLIGRLAIYFVKHKASPTFESSKYKQEMITQRHTVAAWIERLISC